MAIDISASIEACAAHYGGDADKVRQYMREGQKRALALPNRGPLKFDKDRNIHSDILDTPIPNSDFISLKMSLARNNSPISKATSPHSGPTSRNIWAQRWTRRDAPH